MRDALLVTCEHGGNAVPARHRALFAGRERLLSSHRGWDPGALPVARRLAAALDAPLVASTTTRLLVELNRSPDHPDLFSAVTRPLDGVEKRRILARHYEPYRRDVERRIAAAIARRGRVVHVSVHSFTPVLGGVARNTDFGLLYDPSRARERALCRAWKAALADVAPALRVRRNFPYRGVADGFIPYLRRRHGPRTYVGIEIEMSQGRLRGPKRAVSAYVTAVLETARRVLCP